MLARNSDLYLEVRANSWLFPSSALRASRFPRSLRSTSAFCSAAAARFLAASCSLVCCNSFLLGLQFSGNCCDCSSGFRFASWRSMLLSTIRWFAVRLFKESRCEAVKALSEPVQSPPLPDLKQHGASTITLRGTARTGRSGWKSCWQANPKSGSALLRAHWPDDPSPSVSRRDASSPSPAMPTAATCRPIHRSPSDRSLPACAFTSGASFREQHLPTVPPGPAALQHSLKRQVGFEQSCSVFRSVVSRRLSIMVLDVVFQLRDFTTGLHLKWSGVGLPWSPRSH